MSSPRDLDDAYTEQYRVERTHNPCRHVLISAEAAEAAQKLTEVDGLSLVDSEELYVAASQWKTKASEPGVLLEA